MFSVYLWIFLIFLLFLFILLDFFHPFIKSFKLSFKSLFLFAIFWFFLVSAFLTIIYINKDQAVFVEFITSYFVEFSLSLDNVFVFIVVFYYFNIEACYQHKILFLGILGAIIFRLLIIILGTYVFKFFDWIFLPLAFFLIYSGFILPQININFKTDFKKNYICRLMEIFFKINNSKDHKGKFCYKDKGKIVITQLGLSLIIIEEMDLIFAFDSIPIVLTITGSSFIAFSSNVLAIFGLRLMFFVFSKLFYNLWYFKHGIAYVFIYIGFKMILDFIELTVNNYLCTFIVFFVFILVTLISALNKKN